MECKGNLTKIIIKTLLIIDSDAIRGEAQKLGKEFKGGDNEGITKVFFIKPDLSASEKSTFTSLIGKIGIGSVT